jgi:hypothetical protein
VQGNTQQDQLQRQQSTVIQISNSSHQPCRVRSPNPLIAILTGMRMTASAASARSCSSLLAQQRRDGNNSFCHTQGPKQINSKTHIITCSVHHDLGG